MFINGELRERKNEWKNESPINSFFADNLILLIMACKCPMTNQLWVANINYVDKNAKHVLLKVGEVENFASFTWILINLYGLDMTCVWDDRPSELAMVWIQND